MREVDEVEEAKEIEDPGSRERRRERWALCAGFYGTAESRALTTSIYEMAVAPSGFVMRDGCRGGRGGGDAGVLRWLVRLGWRALRVLPGLRTAWIARFSCCTPCVCVEGLPGHRSTANCGRA